LRAVGSSIVNNEKAHQEIEWVNLEGNMAVSRMDIGLRGFLVVFEFGIMYGWPIQQSDSGACGTRTRSRDFVRNTRCAACSAIRKRASSPSYDAQKNDLRLLRSSSFRVVRPAHATRSRSLVWGHAYLPGDRGAARAMPKMRQSETRAAGVSGRQSLLYQALCPLRGPALPAGDDQGHCPGIEPGLGYGQDTGEAVHAGAARPRGHALAQGDRHRRDLDSQG